MVKNIQMVLISYISVPIIDEKENIVGYKRTSIIDADDNSYAMKKLTMKDSVKAPVKRMWSLWPIWS